MYKSLRNLRVVTASALVVVITLTMLDAITDTTPIGRLLMKAQLVPAILAGSAMWIVIWVVITITFGRVYCSTVCPLGTLMDAAAFCRRSTGKGAKARYRYLPPRNQVRFLCPTIVAAALCLGLTAVVKCTDPSFIYYRIVLAVAKPAAIGTGSLAGAMVVGLLIAATAWRSGRILCNTVCPAGGLLGLLSRNPIYRVDINTDLCIHCGKCEDVCKSGCINLTDCTVDNSRCVMCLNCTATCPNAAITVRRGRYTLSTPMMQRTAICAKPPAGLGEKGKSASKTT